MHLLDIDQLRTFVAIADTGSFTRAAEIVHKTQSAVSMQMKRLEDRVGKAIFERDGRLSKLTDEGERLLDYARRIVRLNTSTTTSSPAACASAFPTTTPTGICRKFSPASRAPIRRRR
jgi:DNA-binding transcriptional LysR family regulator